MGVDYYTKKIIEAHLCYYMHDYGAVAVIIDGDRVIINPNGENTYSMFPQLTISSVRELERIILPSFQEAVMDPEVMKKFDIIERRRTFEYYLESQIISASNSDFEDIGRFFKKRTSFLYDNTFNEFAGRSPIEIGQLSDTEKLYVSRNCCEGMCYETPYYMQYSISDGENIIRLPKIRYAIETTDNGDKVAHIYAVQGQKSKNEKTDYEKKVEETLWSISFKNTKYKDVYRPALFSLAIFIGMLKSENITNIVVPDMMYARWIGHVISGTLEQSIAIQHNQTDRFLFTFLNLTEQFEGLRINAFPNDIDSFMHVSIDNELRTDEPLLGFAYETGRSVYEKTKCDNTKVMTKR